MGHFRNVETIYVKIKDLRASPYITENKHLIEESRIENAEIAEYFSS